MIEVEGVVLISLSSGLAAHFLHDPFPKRLLDDAGCTAVQAALDAAADPVHPDARAFVGVADALPPFVDLVLTEAGANGFAAFTRGNTAALRDGQKAFIADAYGEGVSYLARPAGGVGPWLSG